jgi:hypothetical protein
MIQIRLFQGGKEVLNGKETTVKASQRSSGGGIVAVDTFKLPDGLPPGEYFLQIIVIDKQSSSEKQVANQWIDFEIVK